MVLGGGGIENFISLGNELKPERIVSNMLTQLYFISLGNELKPELMTRISRR